MISKLLREYNLIQLADIKNIDIKLLKESINSLLICAHKYKSQTSDNHHIDILQEIANGCHKKLRELNNQDICTMDKCDFYYCDIAELIENLVAACDLILSGSGKRIVLNASGEEVLQACSPETIVTMVLNLISNACLNLGSAILELNITIGKNSTFISFKAPCNGNNPFLGKDNSALAVKKGAQLHGGTLVFLSNTQYCRAAFSIPFEVEPTNYEEYIPLDFIEYICDRLSPIYTGLCDVCTCPL